MYEFHGDKQYYFNMTRQVTEAYILPFLTPHLEQGKVLDILEIGCGEAGVLQAFTQLGHRAVGIELEESRTELARGFMAAPPASCCMRVRRLRWLANRIAACKPCSP